jgi:hypothetical protein
VVTANIAQAHEARIAVLERLMGKRALENEFLKGPRATQFGQEARARSSSPAR